MRSSRTSNTSTLPSSRPPRRSATFSEKQRFLNTVYERFFQGFCVKVADTHGIVYTPQPLVDFMVASVEHVLQTRIQDLACGQKRAYSRPVYRHGQFHRQPDAADSQKRASAQISRGTALQRTDAAAILCRLDEHRTCLLGGDRRPTRRSRAFVSWIPLRPPRKHNAQFDIFNEANTERVSASAKRRSKSSSPIRRIMPDKSTRTTTTRIESTRKSTGGFE